MADQIDFEKYLEDSLKYEQFTEAADKIKSAPEFIQNLNLIMLCRLDPTGTIEPMARTLAEYDIPSQKIVPCIMDLMKIIGKPHLKHGIE